MKQHAINIRRSLAAMAVTGILAASVGISLAQPGGGGRGGQGGQGFQQGGGPGGPGGGFGGQAGGPGGAAFGGRGGFGFGLDDQQRQLINDALQKDNETLRKLEEQLQAAQKELMKAVLAEEYVEKTVREKAEAVAKLQTEMLMIRSKAMSTVAPTLQAEQRTQLEDSRFGFMMLSGGFGGGGGRGGMIMGGGPQGGPQGGPGGQNPQGQGGRGGRGNRGNNNQDPAQLPSQPLPPGGR
jgi:Spy/CpxP family protein refolding chaperone